MGELDATYYQKSYDMAEHVITFELDPGGYYPNLVFTSYYYTDENKKRYEEVLFCLSNQKLMEDKASLTTGTSSTVFYHQNS